MSEEGRRAYTVQEFKMKKQAERAIMNPKRQSAAMKEAVRDPSAEKVDRSPLTAWEKYAQALLMTAEMAYVN